MKAHFVSTTNLLDTLITFQAHKMYFTKLPINLRKHGRQWNACFENLIKAFGSDLTEYGKSITLKLMDEYLYS